MECSRCDYYKAHNCKYQCMDLPEGKTCADCVHAARCTLMFGAKPENHHCGFEPIRFVEKKSENGGDMSEEVDFSCFANYRSEAGGVRRGECTGDHECEKCKAYNAFYEKAEEYQKAGNSWGKSVALAGRFFGIPTVPEYEVEAYS